MTTASSDKVSPEISIHALREEGDHQAGVGRCRRGNISIHALREEGDGRRQNCWFYSKNFYPRPPRGGRRDAVSATGGGNAISIHALREEGDPYF